MIVQDGEPNWLLQQALAITNLPRLRRYRTWRTSAYYDFIHGEFEELGIGPGEGKNETMYGLPAGAESRAAAGIPERSRFLLAVGERTPPSRPVSDAQGLLSWIAASLWGQMASGSRPAFGLG